MLYIFCLSHITVDRDRLAALAGDLRDNALSSLLAGGVFTTTAAPAAAKPFAIPAPIPFDAPVTTATLPVSSLICLLRSRRHPFDS